jgi:hypothetical protein
MARSQRLRDGELEWYGQRSWYHCVGPLWDLPMCMHEWRSLMMMLEEIMSRNRGGGSRSPGL